MKVLKAIPTLLYVVAVYNILVFLFENALGANVFQLTLASGALWGFTVNELLISAAVIFLYIEIFKSTRTSSASIIDHALSMALFIACLLEFIIVLRLGTSTFFIITLICLLDVVAGFTITISAARRDFGIGAHADT